MHLIVLRLNGLHNILVRVYSTETFSLLGSLGLELLDPLDDASADAAGRRSLAHTVGLGSGRYSRLLLSGRLSDTVRSCILRAFTTTGIVVWAGPGAGTLQCASFGAC
jgi:hypothetical protein